MKRYFFWLGIIYGLTLFLACQAKTQKGTVVAKVGGDEIKFEDLDEQFFQRLELYEDTAAQYRLANAYLDSMVNQKLLIRAAYSAKIDQDREIGILADEQRPRFLIDELYKMEILEKSVPTAREQKDFYQKTGEQRKLRHLLVKTREEAEEIYRQLKKGADFEQLAKEKSTDQESKENGGDLGLVTWGTMVDPFQQAAWKLKQGEISKPVETVFGWHLIKLEEIKKLEQKPFKEVAEFQKQRLQFSKQTRLTQDFLDKLQKKAEVKMDSSTYALMLERDTLEAKKDLLSTPKPSGSHLKLELFSESEKALPVLTYQGGSITLADFVQQYTKIPPFQRGPLQDRQRVQQIAFQMVMGDLLEKEAIKRKADSRPDYKKNILKIKEAMMADKLRSDYIMLNAKLTDEDLHAYYDSHLEQFQIPEMVKIQEVLVATEAEAAKLAKQIKGGANFAKLADEYTLRPGMKGRGGILDSISQARNAVLFDAVKNVKIGRIVGPVPVSDKFSVIKLLERRPMKQLAYGEVQLQLRRLAYEEKKKAVFQQWAENRKKTDPVEIYWDTYRVKLDEKLAPIRAAQASGEKARGTFPLKVKVGPGGKIEKANK